MIAVESTTIDYAWNHRLYSVVMHNGAATCIDKHSVVEWKEDMVRQASRPRHVLFLLVWELSSKVTKLLTVPDITNLV